MFFALFALLLLILIFVLWIMFAVKVAKEAELRGESFVLFLLGGLCLSPVTTAIILLLVSSRTEKSMKEQVDVISQNVYATAETLKRIERQLSSEEKTE